MAFLCSMTYWILLPKAEDGCIKPYQCQVNSTCLELTYYIETLVQGALDRQPIFSLFAMFSLFVHSNLVTMQLLLSLVFKFFSRQEWKEFLWLDNTKKCIFHGGQLRHQAQDNLIGLLACYLAKRVRAAAVEWYTLDWQRSFSSKSTLWVP